MPCSIPGYEDILRKYKNKDEFTRRYTVIKVIKTTKLMCTFQSVAYIETGIAGVPKTGLIFF